MQLCRFLEANLSWKPYAQKAVDNRRGPLGLSTIRHCIETKRHELNDIDVHDILARWQGLRPLQDLYLNADIQAYYRTTIPPCRSGHTECTWHGKACKARVEQPMFLIQDLLRQQRCAPSKTQLSMGEFQSQQTGRFYKATVRYWLARESMDLIRETLSETVRGFWAMHDMMSTLASCDIVERNDDSSILDEVDALEVYDFVQGFLLCNHFSDIRGIRDWASTNQFNPRVSEHITWNRLMSQFRRCVTGPVAIELLSKATRTPEEKRRFARLHGLDKYTNPLLVSLEKLTKWGLRNAKFFESTVMEALAVRCRAKDFSKDSQEAVITGWKAFRREWTSPDRFSPFWAAHTSREILEIMEDVHWSMRTTHKTHDQGTPKSAIL